MASQFDTIPVEVLAKILSFLKGYEIAKVSCTCRSMYESSKIDFIWQLRCELEFNIPKLSTQYLGSYYQLYSKVLHPCGYLLGYWQSNMEHYGGIIHSKLTEEGDIVVSQYHAVGLVSEPLYEMPICTISLNQATQKLSYKCGKAKKHGCTLKKTDSKVIFTCLADKPDATHKKELVKTLDAYEDDQNKEFVHDRFREISSLYKSFSWQRLTFPGHVPGAPIQPGLFTGTYGAHGTEILMLCYDHLETANMLKITGDPNVPAQKVSVAADLRRAMVLTEEQQTSIELLANLDTPDLPSPSLSLQDLPKQQPFVVPADVWERDEISGHKYCKSRFHSQSLIANHNHTEPQHIPGHWIVFDEDTFGHIWFLLSSISLYKRVKDLPAC